MTIITDTASILDKARSGRRVALTSLHSRLGHADKVVSIFDNAFMARTTEPDPHDLHATTHRPVLVLAEYAAA